MNNPEVIQPDLSFSRQLLAAGGGDLRKCFQCATCSVVCDLAPQERPFPRKEMLWAQWGLKDRLLSDPDIWLCHHCNECSIHCPRGARPGDVLAAVRHKAIETLAIPSFLGRWVNQPVFLPVTILIPVVLLLVALLVRDPIERALGLGHHAGEGMQYANLFPHWLLIGFFTFFLTLSVGCVAIGSLRLWRAMKQTDVREGRFSKTKSLGASLLAVFKDILTHRRFGQCQTNLRKTSHLCGFYGFLILFLVSAWAVVLLYILNPMIEDPFVYPFPFWNPAKIVANVGALALILGSALALNARMKHEPSAGQATDFDWLFLVILLLVGVTGVFTEALRYAALVQVGYMIYFVHLVLAFMLLTYLPYSKFAHLFYRTVALIYGEHTGRTLVGQDEVGLKEAVA